jgi:cytochrome b561
MTASSGQFESACDPSALAHLAGGPLILVLALWRLAIRARRGASELAGENAVQRGLGWATHFGLWALMILIPVLLALIALHAEGAFSPNEARPPARSFAAATSLFPYMSEGHRVELGET